MQLQIATSAAELEGMRARWEELFHSTSATLFQTFDWNLLAARVFAEREVPYVIFAENDAGAAIIPACIRRASNTVALLGEELFDYRDYLAFGEPLALHAAWEKLAQLRLPLEVTALRGSKALKRWSWLAPELFCQAPMVAPGEPPPRPRNMYALRRLLRLGASVQRYSPPGRKLIEWIYLQKSQQRGNLFVDALRRAFMHSVVELAACPCEVFTLELEGNVMAALVTFLDGGARRFYTTYFDARWAKYSPGFALLCEATLETLESGRTYDFMTGEQWYKMRLATHTVPLYRIARRQIALGREMPVESVLASKVS
jgi:CelD/BcsL family acetyltransferase involved in cellulose biosynthesis